MTYMCICRVIGDPKPQLLHLSMSGSWGGDLLGNRKVAVAFPMLGVGGFDGVERSLSIILGKTNSKRLFFFPIPVRFLTGPLDPSPSQLDA